MSRDPVGRDISDVDVVVASATYRELIERLKQRIRESQARAAKAVNTELVMLYWSIGREILDQQQAGGWGDDVVGRIAQDLGADTGSGRGFSRRNLFYMRRFAALWPEREKVPPVMAQIAWTHHQVLIDAFGDSLPFQHGKPTPVPSCHRPDTPTRSPRISTSSTRYEQGSSTASHAAGRRSSTATPRLTHRSFRHF
jgi:hypothetical protein